MSLVGSTIEWRVSVVIFRFDICAMLKEQVYYGKMPTISCSVQSCLEITVFDKQVGICIEKNLNGYFVSHTAL